MREKPLQKRLKETIRLLEKKIPANPAENEKLEKELQGELAAYFKDLEKVIPWELIEGLYYKLVEK